MNLQNLQTKSADDLKVIAWDLLTQIEMLQYQFNEIKNLIVSKQQQQEQTAALPETT